MSPRVIAFTLAGFLGALAPFVPGMPFRSSGGIGNGSGSVVANPYLGTLIADAGAFGTITLPTGAVISSASSNQVDFNTTYIVNSAGDGIGGGALSFGGTVVMSHSGNSATFPNGQSTGTGTTLTNIAVGSCTMAAGTTCTATTPGTTTASLCTVAEQSATALTYFPTPGAGTTLVTASLANSAKFVVQCFN